MVRIRKRIIKKKTNIKKNIKLPIKRKPQQAEHKLTSEQQAKQNDMLKIMLARPQQIVPQGTSQQNDELRQKLDSLTRQNTNQANENRELRRLIAEGRTDQQRINDEFRREQELNRQRDQNIRQREAAEDRLHAEQDRGQRLQQRQDDLDNSTEAGRHRQQMADLDTQIFNLGHEREQNEARIRNNELYQQLQRKQADVNYLTEAISAQRDIMNSDDYKNPKPALKTAIFNEMRKQIEKENNDEIIKRQMNVMRMTAEQQAYQQYIDDYTKPSQKIQKRKQDGSLLFGSNGSGKEYAIYEKDKNGKEILVSKAKLHTDELAAQVKAEEEAQIELDRLKLEQENYKNQAREATKAKISNMNTQRELTQIKAYQESQAYLDRLTAMEKAKKEVELKQQQNQHNKNMLEIDKKMKILEAQNRVSAEFDPFQSDVAGVQEQIKASGDNLESILNSHLTNIKNSKELDIQRGNMHVALESLLDNYEGEDRITANNNLIRLIGLKTNDKLKSDIDEYSLYDLQRTTDFINLINRRDTELLLDGKSLDKFIKEDTYKDFEWKI